MADYSMPGMVFDPATATPEQLKYMRELAMQLATPPRAEDIAPHWTGALAAGLRGITGPLYANRANELQQQALRGGTANQEFLERQRQANILRQQQQGAPPPIVQPPAVPPQQNAPAPGAPEVSARPTAYSGAPQGNAQDAISNALKAAILMQESGNQSNAKTSVQGAVGPGQIIPETFQAFAKPGERINDPNANREVSGRILDSYMQKYGDPDRAAVAYFSGPGNVAPPGSATPWIADRKDGYGKSVSSYVSDVRRRMGGGQQVAQAAPGEFDPAAFSAFQNNPWVNPKMQDFYREQVTPKVGTDVDVYGRPTATTPTGGTRGLPVTGGAQPGIRGTVAVGESGVTGPVQILPPGVTNPQPMSQQIQPYLDVQRQAAQQTGVTKALAAQGGQEVAQAFAAFPAMQILNQMEDDIKTHGKDITWGPTGDIVTKIKSGLLQHAPWLVSEKEIDGLAAADTFKKLSTQLATIVGRNAGSTDMALLQGIDSVPHQQNSYQGALALIDMLKQVTALNAKFGMYAAGNAGKQGFDLLKEKEAFFADRRNAIINPITKNPIRIDLENERNKPAGTAKGGKDDWGIVR